MATATISTTADPKDVSVLIIEELPQPNFAGTRFELRGGGLPKQGAAWNGKHRIVTKWYPGNPVATQQALGPQEVPSNWEGMWRRNVLEETQAIWIDEDGGTNAVVHPHILMQILDDIRFRGYPLRVTWSTATGAEGSDVKIVREGRLTDTTFEITRLEDIAWKATFDWKSRGQQTPLVVNIRNPDSGNSLSQWELTMNAVLAAANAFQNSLDPNQLGSTGSFDLTFLFKLATYPTTLVNQLSNQFNIFLSTISDINDLITQTAITPNEVAQKIISMGNNAIQTQAQALNNIMAIPIEYASTDHLDVADIARNAQFLANLVDSINQSQDTTLQIVSQAAKQKQSQSPIDGTGTIVSDSAQAAPYQLYKVVTGDTALSISQEFYGSTDYASAILKANRLAPYTVNLDVGSILIIPKNPSSTDSVSSSA